MAANLITLIFIQNFLELKSIPVIFGDFDFIVNSFSLTQVLIKVAISLMFHAINVYLCLCVYIL